MLQEHYLNVHCSRSIFRHAPGVLCILNMLLEHIICYMLLEHCAFKYAPGAYLTYSRLLMLLEQPFLEQLLQENSLEPKSHKSDPLGRGCKGTVAPCLENYSGLCCGPGWILDYNLCEKNIAICVYTWWSIFQCFICKWVYRPT